MLLPGKTLVSVYRNIRADLSLRVHRPISERHKQLQALCLSVVFSFAPLNSINGATLVLPQATKVKYRQGDGACARSVLDKLSDSASRGLNHPLFPVQVDADIQADYF